jgi:hypothetical protein
MTTRTIETEFDRKMLVRFLENQKLPLTIEIQAGRRRTSHQNRLQRKWMVEISEQLGDRTPEEVRGYCKLHFGVPILRNENDAFCHEYDAIVRPLPYEHKLKLMMVPFDFGVTRIMTTRQKTAYLDAIQKHFSEQGVVLTDPATLERGERKAA